MSGMDRISGGLRGRTPSVTLPLIPVGLGAGTSVAWEAKRKQLTAINGARDLLASPGLIFPRLFIVVVAHITPPSTWGDNHSTLL